MILVISQIYNFRFSDVFNKLKVNPYFCILWIIVATFPFFTGGYYVFTCALLDTILVVILLIKVVKNRGLQLPFNLLGLSFAVVLVFYLLTRFWAVDKSLYIHGFLKFLCPCLLLLNLCQLEESGRCKLMTAVPVSATVMSIVSFCLGQLPKFKNYFFNSQGDLQGFFEYSNAFGVFCLAALYITLFQKYKGVLDTVLRVVVLAVCGFSVIKSGSRATWLVAVVTLAVVVLVFTYRKISGKRGRVIFFSAVATLVAVATVIAFLTGFVSKVYTYATTDLSIVERSLVYHDALLYALKHPFGKGAYAFYYTQPQLQSAYYYVVDTHCDFLQLATEVGLVPTGLLAFCLLRQLFKGKVDVAARVALFALVLHCLMDFDLQFVSLWFVLVLCLDCGKLRQVTVNSRLIPVLMSVVVIALSFVVGMSAYYNHKGQHKKSLDYYRNTPSLLMALAVTTDQQTGYNLATEILKLNNNVFEANNMLANIYSANDRYSEAITQFELVLEKNPREMKEYKAYIDLCLRAKSYYDRAGNLELSRDCSSKIASVSEKLRELKQSTPLKAIRYARKQNFSIGSKYEKIIKNNKEIISNGKVN